MTEGSSCLRRSFSQPSSSLHEATEGDPIHALTSSISFGRYVSESLAWEKWSAFTHNRYMEEIEKYSRPGSVAEMKAYFEAHFNRKAAARSAALLEQQNVAAPSTSELNVRTEKQQDTPMCQDLAQKDNYVAAEEMELVEAPKSDIGFSVEVCGHTPSPEGRKSENIKIEEIEQPVLAENQDGATLEDSATPDKKKYALPFTKSRVPKPPAPPEPPVSLADRPNVKASPKGKKTAADSTDKRRETPRSLHMSINFENQDGAALGDSATSNRKKYALPFTKSRAPKPPAPPRPPVSNPNRTNIKASPSGKKTAADSTDKRRETPRSLHMSINFSSRQINKPLSPILQKIANSRLVKTLAKATQQAPTRDSLDTSRRPTVNPQRGNNWSQESLNQPIFGSGSGKVEGKSQSTCTRGSKSPSVRESKARSPIVSYSFSFKSEERAAKRKEFFERLEQKAKDSEKEQLQVKSKEKARCNKDKLSSTSKPKLMFSQGTESLTDPSEKVKARSQLPLILLQEKARCDHQDIHSPATSKFKPHLKFSPGTVSPSDPVKKVPLMIPCSPKVGRQTPSKLQDINSRPPWRLTTKTDGCNDSKGKNLWDPAPSAKSVPKKTMLENASPNIIQV